MQLKKVQISKLLPIAILYFFFNSLFLPKGLMYTTLLTPFFIFWIYKNDALRFIWPFFAVTVPFMVIHFFNGVDLFIYFKSYLLLFSVYIFCIAFWIFLGKIDSLELLFNNITVLNFFMVIVAVFILMTPWYDLMWYKNELTPGAGETFRLKLLTYEASYYSLLLVPIVLFFYFKILLRPFRNKGLIFFLVSLPLLLSLSFGVILGLILTLILLFCYQPRLLLRNSRLLFILIIVLVLLAVIFLILFKYYPDNVVFARFENIFAGTDASFKGRTYDSFYLAWKLADENSLLFGSGPGQIKVIGVELFNKYYLENFTPEEIVIPNNIADILAKYGIIGVLFKLGMEIYLFIKMKVNRNYYRLALFLFVFIYQFTGSFITNIVEYVIWMMAFYPLVFTEFNRENVFPVKAHS